MRSRANAPLSYGAFEVTVGVYPNVPGPDELLAEMAAAGYAGTELGPPGYLGEGDELRERLERHGLALTGGWCPGPLQRARQAGEEDSPRSAGRSTCSTPRAPDARPGFGDAGSGRAAREPGRGGHAELDDAGWGRWAEGVRRAEEVARDRGYEPTLHPHTSTYVESPWEIERALWS